MIIFEEKKIKTIEDYVEFEELKTDEELYRQVYQIIVFLCDFRYKHLIEKLTRYRLDYTREDFIQDSMENSIKQLKTKKFPTINHLKSFLNRVIQYHYVYMNRRFFILQKSNQGMQYSIECAFETQNIKENYKKDKYYKTVVEKLNSIYVQSDCINIDNLQFKFLYEKNLVICVNFSSKTFRIKPINLLFNFNRQDDVVYIPVSFLLEKTMQLKSRREVVKYFLSKNIKMTAQLLNKIYNALFDYLKKNNLVEK